MLANQLSYEQGLEDLKLVCDAYIEDLKRRMPCEEIRPYVNELDDRNTELSVDAEQGVVSSGLFAETKANMAGIDISNYKIV